MRLVRDEFGGQSKDMHIKHMNLFDLLSHSPPNLKDVTIFLPIRGHSCLPTDGFLIEWRYKLKIKYYKQLNLVAGRYSFTIPVGDKSPSGMLPCLSDIISRPIPGRPKLDPQYI